MDKSKSLISLVADFAELDRLLIEAGGEMTDDLERELDLTQENLAAKVDNYKRYMDHLEYRALFFDDVVKQAQHAKKIFENHRERLKQNIKETMRALTTTELAGNEWRFKGSASKPKVVVDNGDLVPAKYQREVKSLVVDKEAVAADLALGANIPGVHLEESMSVRAYVNHAGKAREVGGRA